MDNNPNQGSQVPVAAQPKGAVAKAPRKVDILKSMLNADSIQAQFKNALKNNAGTFIASVIDLYNSDSNLQQCEPKAIVCEALKAAVLHLPINKALGFAYIIPFNNSKKVVNPETGKEEWTKVMEPTFQMGYKGYIQLAMRTGWYKTINADCVYEGEFKSVNKLTGEVDFSGTRTSDKVVGYFCYFELLNGFTKCLYMTVEQMAQHAKRYSKGLKKDTTVESLVALAAQPVQADSKIVGWMGNFHGMAVKTVIRQLLGKSGYLSVEMERAVLDDQRGDSYEIRDNVIQNNANTRVIDMDGGWDDSGAIVVDAQEQQPQLPEPPAEPATVDPGF